MRPSCITSPHQHPPIRGLLGNARRRLKRAGVVAAELSGYTWTTVESLVEAKWRRRMPGGDRADELNGKSRRSADDPRPALVAVYGLDRRGTTFARRRLAWRAPERRGCDQHRLPAESDWLARSFAGGGDPQRRTDHGAVRALTTATVSYSQPVPLPSRSRP